MYSLSGRRVGPVSGYYFCRLSRHLAIVQPLKSCVWLQGKALKAFYTLCLCVCVCVCLCVCICAADSLEAGQLRRATDRYSVVASEDVISSVSMAERSTPPPIAEPDYSAPTFQNVCLKRDGA